MPLSRKHRVVLEIITHNPRTEKDAIASVKEELYYADYFNMWAAKCTAKSYRRVHAAHIIKLLDTMPRGTASIMREYL